MVIQYQNGDGSAARSLFMNFIKGLMAPSYLPLSPVLLFQFVLELQKYITVALTGSMDLDGQMLNAIEQIGIILNGGSRLLEAKPESPALRFQPARWL